MHWCSRLTVFLSFFQLSSQAHIKLTKLILYLFIMIKIPRDSTLPKSSVTSLTALLATVVLVSACAQTQQEPETMIDQRDSGWKLVWQDEFDGSHIDENKWAFEEHCWGGGNDEMQCYTDRKKNAYVEQGYLVIEAHSEEFSGIAVDPNTPNLDPNFTKTLPYTSARLSTKNSADWKYGRIEVRAKMPQGQGTWPAIWMLPTNAKYGPWPASGEIDIVEAVNLKTPSGIPGAKQGQLENRVHGTLHFGRQHPQNVHSAAEYPFPDDSNPADTFHTYAIEWEEGEIRWYVDGMHFGTQRQEGWYSQTKNEFGGFKTNPGAAPFDHPFYLILNLAIGGQWASLNNLRGIHDDIFPQKMMIDFVRVYQCETNMETGKGCASYGESPIIVPGIPTPPEEERAENLNAGDAIYILGENPSRNVFFGGFNPTSEIHYLISDGEYGKPQLRIHKTGDMGNIYFSLLQATDLSSWVENGALRFDAFVVSSDPETDVYVKIDSEWPHASDILLPKLPVGQWQQVSIPLKRFAEGRNRFEKDKGVNFTKIKNVIVVEPTGPMDLYLTNIRWERQ